MIFGGGGGSIARLIVGGSLNGSIFAEGTINEVNIGGTLGTETGSLPTITALGGFGSGSTNGLVADTIRANIVTPFNLLHLQANNFFGSLECQNISAFPSGTRSGINVTDELAATINIKGTLQANSKIRAGRITGQVNIGTDGTGFWDGPVTVGTLTTTNLSPRLDYTQTPATVGGGSIGILPFRLHKEGSSPSYDRNSPGPLFSKLGFNSGTIPLTLRFYGPVITNPTSARPVQLFRRDNPTVPGTLISTSDYLVSYPDARSIRIIPVADLPIGRYEIVTQSSLKSDLPSAGSPTVPSATYIFGLRCMNGGNPNPCDLADDQGTPLYPFGNPVGANTGVNEGDYNCFFNNFFLPPPSNAVCNFADDQGNVPPNPAAANSGVNEGDYNAFFNNFFIPCV